MSSVTPARPVSTLRRADSLGSMSYHDTRWAAGRRAIDVRLAGTLRRKSGARGNWNERFFCLRGPVLEYFTSQAHLEPKGSFALAGCKVGELREVKSGGRTLHAMRLTWAQNPDDEHVGGPESTPSRASIPSTKELSSAHGDDSMEMTPRQSPRSPSLRQRTAEMSKTNETLERLLSQDESHKQAVMNRNEASLHGHDQLPNQPRGKGYRIDKSKVKTGLKVGAVAGAGVAVGVLTMGVGLVAGAAVLGVGIATTGVGGVGYLKYKSKKSLPRPMLIAAETKEEAEIWRSAIMEQIEHVEQSMGWVSSRPNSVSTILPPPHCMCRGHSGVVTPPASSSINLIIADNHLQRNNWIHHATINGMRILREVEDPQSEVHGVKDTSPVQNSSLLKCCVRVGASPLDTMMSILSGPDACLNGIMSDIEIVEVLNDHTDVIRVVARATVLGGVVCASQRDFCLARYWFRDSKGNYFIHMASTEHSRCPPQRGSVRAFMRSTFSITGRVYDGPNEIRRECLVTHICQCHPMGYLRGSVYSEFLYTSKLLLSVLDARDTVEIGAYHRLELDFAPPPPQNLVIDPSSTRRVSVCGGMSKPPSIGGVPISSPQYDSTFIDISRIHAFQARGADYNETKKKDHAGEPIGELVRADFFAIAGRSRIDHISSQGNYASLLDKLILPGHTLFVLNFQAPFNPLLSMVIVWRIPDKSDHPQLDQMWANFRSLPSDIQPDGKLPASDFRTKRFKLFCMVPQGPWIVRKVVGSTPVLLAQKLTCRYFSRPGVFELAIDIGSSAVANNTCSLAGNHAKAIVVDLGVSIQAEENDEMPERLLGAVRLNYPNLGLADVFEEFEAVGTVNSGNAWGSLSSPVPDLGLATEYSFSPAASPRNRLRNRSARWPSRRGKSPPINGYDISAKPL